MGAIIGLELVIRHAERVSTLVAHEPSYGLLLDERARADATRTQDTVDDTYRLAGRTAAMRRLAVLTGADTAGAESDAPPTRVGIRTAANAEFFLANESAAVRRYVMDFDALVGRAAGIVPAAGYTSRHVWPHRCAQALAARLGVRLIEFPGGHEGYRTHPRGFAELLREVFLDRPEPPNHAQP